jgi:Xaa-Pro dipeptidase
VIDERQLRVTAAARSVGAGWAVITSPDSVCYATGYEVAYETGPSPFAGGPVTVLVAPDATTHLVVVNSDTTSAQESHAASVTGYEGFSVDHPLRGHETFAGAVAATAKAIGLSGVCAVERGSFPWSLGEALDPFVTAFVPFDDALSRARMVKTPDEITALRRCGDVASAGQRAAAHATREGRSELDVFAAIRLAMETLVGRRVCVAGEYSSGVDRTAAVFDWPGTRRLERGDPVIVDLAPRVAGYWGDSCNTLVVGAEASHALSAVHAAATAGIECACETLRPGITAAAFDAAVRRAVVAAGGGEYPHHSGHGIGASVHENPRLVPGDTTMLEPGMVIMVEPATYHAGVASARLEWMFLVTDAGNEVLTHFPHRLV